MDAGTTQGNVTEALDSVASAQGVLDSKSEVLQLNKQHQQLVI
jgi:hypothetical protein